MDPGQQVVLGMVVAYFFALLGMTFAWVSYYRQKKDTKKKK